MTPWTRSAYRSTGVYAITCRTTGKRYIGSAQCSFGGRWSRHLLSLERGSHPNSYLQNAWNKYGCEDFDFTILDILAGKDAVQREQDYFDVEIELRKNGSDKGNLFNCSLIARGERRPCSQEAAMRIREYKRIHPESVRRGDQNGARLHPERMASGDDNGSRLHPESRPRGDNHWTRKMPERMQSGNSHWTRRLPEKVPRGEDSGPRLHPERRPRGDAHHARRTPEVMSRGDEHYLRLHPEKIRRGVDAGNAKINDVIAQEILYRHAAGESGASIERSMGLKNKYAYSVIRRKSWAHVPVVEAPPTYSPPESNLRIGENAAHVKVSEALVRDILQRHARGESGAYIKKALKLNEMGLSDKYVYDVIKRKIWKSVVI